MRRILLLIISIMILSLVGCSPAVDLYNETQDIVSNEETLNELEESLKTSKNSRIEMYEGAINGMEVKALIRTVNQYNENGILPTKLVINDYSNSDITLVNGKYLDDGVKSANEYKISLEYGENGFITEINVNDKKSTSDVTISNYYFEESSEKLLKDMSEYANITNLKYSKKELEYAKNEIFARHGHDFVSEELKEYFSSQTWYKKIDGKQVSVSELNEIEKENVKLLDEYILLTKELEEKGQISKRINFYHTLIINKDKTFDLQTLSRKIYFLDEQGNRLKLFDINTGNDAFSTTYFDHEFLASDGYLYSTKDVYDESGADSIKARKVYDKKIVSYSIKTERVNTQYDEFLERDSYTYNMKIIFNFADGTSVSEDVLYEPDKAV